MEEDLDAADYIFAISLKGWTNCKLGMEWLKHFDHITKPPINALSPYRLLIIPGHNSHIILEFVKYCDEVNIKPDCLSPHSTHWLQPLDVGLFSALQKAYGKAVDRSAQFAFVSIWRGNFLALLVEARGETYTEANIAAQWRGAGLSPFHAWYVLDNIPHGYVSDPSSPPPTTIIATPKNSSDLLRQTRQAQLMLKGESSVDKAELLDVIERLERHGIAADTDRDLERVTFSKWQESVKLAAPKDKRHIGKGYDEVIDGRTVARLYKERAEADLKKAQAAEKRKAKQEAGQAAPGPSTKAKKVTIQSPVVIAESDSELEGWDTDSSSSSSAASTLSVIPVSTPFLPLRRGITPRTPPSPLTGPSRRSFIVIPSTPSTPHSRVTRSRSKCI